MTKKWVNREALISKQIKLLPDYPELIARLLRLRDINTKDRAVKFLNPNYEADLHDPFLLSDMDKAVGRILQAIERQEKIVIFGDYDADGIPGAVILSSFFDKIGFNNYEAYIPDRQKQSYGLSLDQIKQFADLNFKLLITVDCGITDEEEIALANKLGLETIITDHHIVQATRPQALAIINPKKPEDKYPFKDLAGAGVAFKLVQGLIARGSFNLPVGWEKWLLDLVAIATVSDMMPMIGENRTLTHFGLLVIGKNRRPGLASLLRSARLNPRYINEDDIGFMIGPRINSAGRMAQAVDAYHLLSATDEVEAETLASTLEKRNRQRKEMLADIVSQAEELIADPNLSVLVFGHKDWSPGVLGLVAGRLAEKFGRPVFVWGRNGNDEIKGSCRGFGLVNVVELMARAGGQDFFIDFGGHAGAGGFSLAPGREQQLSERLNQATKDLSFTDDYQVEISYDFELSLSEIGSDTLRLINRLAPFGTLNPKPIFLFSGLTIDAVRTFGGDDVHLEINFKNGDRRSMSAIGFFSCPPTLPEEAFDGEIGHNFPGVVLSPNRKVDLLASLEKNFFGTGSYRLRIVDIRPAN